MQDVNKRAFPIDYPVTENITEAEFYFLKTQFYDLNTGLSVNNKGEVLIKQRGQIRPIAKFTFNKGILCYHQPEKIGHLLKSWEAWTIDKVIFEKLPDNTLLFYYVENGTFFYTKEFFLQLKQKLYDGLLGPTEKKYEEKHFIGHGLRIVLPIAYSKFYNNITFKEVFPNEY